MFLVVCGKVTQGLRFFGPFKTKAEANEWIEKVFPYGPMCMVARLMDVQE